MTLSQKPQSMSWTRRNRWMPKPRCPNPNMPKMHWPNSQMTRGIQTCVGLIDGVVPKVLPDDVAKAASNMVASDLEELKRAMRESLDAFVGGR